MNILPKGAHSMRIIALPLTRVKVSPEAKINPSFDLNASTMLVFYHFDLISPCSDREPEDLSWHRTVLKNAMNKASDLWNSLGKAPKGSWKLRTYELGERIADGIEFEELALRNVDPSLGPTVPLTATSRQVDDGENRSQLHLFPKIPLIYPPSLYPPCLTTGEVHALRPPLAHLQTLLASRGPRHRRGFYLWMLIAPLTTPIMLIPLIPNFPLFFCVWRSWSHYRGQLASCSFLRFALLNALPLPRLLLVAVLDTAYKSSQYLSSLLDHGLIKPDPSLELDKLYASVTSSSRISQGFPPAPRPPEKKSAIGSIVADGKSEAASGTGSSQSECILLTRKAMPHILKMFRLPESALVHMYRAMDQARGRQGASSSPDSS